MQRALLLAAGLAAATATAATAAAARTPAQEAFIADLTARVASGVSAPQALAEATAAERVRAAGRLRAAHARGALGDVVVTTSLGPLIGIGGGNASVNPFLGVPFAQPPVGALRWAAPQAPQAWGPTPRNATWFGLTCMQSEWYWGILTGLGEDCLNLDIYVPNKAAPPGGFPVMLFFYGGSFTYGGASFPLYDGETDVALMKDVILVSANYRLNVFGFLAGDELQAESGDGSVGNYGLQDQRAAMRFVQAEIAAFGGDPTRVTIFGESAGGASVSNHLVSPRSLGLFAGAIIESGSFSDWTAQPLFIARTRLPQVAANCGCPTSGAPMLACLRAVNETTMLAADHGLTSAFLEWAPTIDGVEVVDDPRVLVRDGKVAPVPVMLGFNADEGTLFNSAKTDLNASGFIGAIADFVGPVVAPTVAAQYPLQDYESPWWAICAMLGDSQMICPGQQSAAWLGNASRPGGPKTTHVYYYTQILAILDVVDLFRNLRCCHGSELISVFDFSVALIGAGEADMARAFVGFWTNFASSGDPNVGAASGLPLWPAFGASRTVGMIATTPAGVNFTVVEGGVRQQQCAFWQTLNINATKIFGSP